MSRIPICATSFSSTQTTSEQAIVISEASSGESSKTAKVFKARFCTPQAASAISATVISQRWGGFGKEVLRLTMGALCSPGISWFLQFGLDLPLSGLVLHISSSRGGISLNLRALCGGHSYVTYESSGIPQLIRASADGW